jgi:hypothetical protein
MLILALIAAAVCAIVGLLSLIVILSDGWPGVSELGFPFWMLVAAFCFIMVAHGLNST